MSLRNKIKDFRINSNSKLRIFSRFLTIISSLIIGFFLFNILSTQILPAKYAYPLLAVLVFIALLSLFFTYRTKTHKGTLVVFDMISIFLAVVLSYGSIKLSETFSFLNQNLNKNSRTAVYDIIVNKDSEYKELTDLRSRSLLSYEELIKEVSDEQLVNATRDRIADISIDFSSDIENVMSAPVKDKISAIIVNDGTYGSYVDTHKEYEGKVRILGTIETNVEVSEEDKDRLPSKSLTEKPFIMLISGIDTRTGTMPTRSLSDVNILVAINPVTRDIQMITTPRDAYVQLHGTTGLKDKLTHAGARGGIELTKATLEDFYGVKIDRYVRVNFNFVIKLVDAIGGISINNDVNYDIKLKECDGAVKPGENRVDGKCALRFARERKQYSDGDRHRGRNQMHVIERVLQRVTSGTTFLTHYTDILNSLNGTFNTDMLTDDITALVRMQLDDMRSWRVKSFSVNGKGQMTKTYSYPNQNLYVMNLDPNTVEEAKKKINLVLGTSNN